MAKINDARVASRVTARFLQAMSRTATSTWYHLTDRAKFKLDPKFTPEDNAVAIEDRSGRAGIYLCPDVERWVNGHGYWRPFVVEFHVDPCLETTRTCRWSFTGPSAWSRVCGSLSVRVARPLAPASSSAWSSGVEGRLVVYEPSFTSQQVSGCGSA